MKLYLAAAGRYISTLRQPSKGPESDPLEKHQLTLYFTEQDAITASSSQGLDTYPVITVEFEGDTDSLPSSEASKHVSVPAWKIKYLEGALSTDQEQEIINALKSAKTAKNEYDKQQQPLQETKADLGAKTPSFNNSKTRKRSASHQRQNDGILLINQILEALNEKISTHENETQSQQLDETTLRCLSQQKVALTLLQQKLTEKPKAKEVLNDIIVKLDNIFETYNTDLQQSQENLTLLESLIQSIENSEVSNSEKSVASEEPSAKTSLFKHGMQLASSLGSGCAFFYISNGLPDPIPPILCLAATVTTYFAIQGADKFINGKVTPPQHVDTSNPALVLLGSDESLSLLSKRNSLLDSGESPSLLSKRNNSFNSSQQVKRHKQDQDQDQDKSALTTSNPNPITPQRDLKQEQDKVAKQSANDPTKPTDKSRNTPKIVNM